MTEPDEHSAAPESRFARYGVANSDLAQVIIRFAEPMLKYCETYEKREEALSYAILAWNLSLENAAVRDAALQDIAAQVPEEQRTGIEELMRYLLKRKEAEFADNRFLIVDYRLIRQDESMQIEMTTRYVPRT
ncbi:MAG TPA: hypothetical protein PKI62_08135 [bacterium]|nr:hypothetical protein [bacterium]HPR88458.1 hypothetical protein [bacterium]